MEKNFKTPHWKQRLDPRWQKKRLEIMERDGYACQFCKSKYKTLNVHHRWYVSHRMVWEYPDVALMTLCEDCHEELSGAECLTGFETELQHMEKTDSSKLLTAIFLFCHENSCEERAVVQALALAVQHQLRIADIEQFRDAAARLYKEHNDDPELIPLFKTKPEEN